MREPIGRAVRLMCMKSVWFVALVCIALIGAPASAQENVTTLSATVGIGNWVAGNAPMTVHATVDSDVLVTGTLEIVYGGATTHIPVDVPAGGSKTYDVPVRSAFGNGSIRVNLLDDDDDRLATQTLRPEVADDELAVAVVADEAVTATLDALESAVDGISIQPVAAPSEMSTDEAEAFAYVVASEPTEAQWQYVARGGRLVTTSRAIAGSVLPLTSLGTVPGTGVDWYAAPGRGEVFALDTIAPNRDWSLVLRPAPLALIPAEQWGTPESSLLQSATSSGDGGLASIPWLPFGMLAYLIIIGPLNLFVLKRVGRRELAWISVPALALVTVGVFWAAGRQRLDSTTARHATIAVTDDQPYRRSLTVLAAGNSDDYSIALPGIDDYAISDVSSAWGGNVGTTAPGTVDADGVSWELPQLGVGAVETWSSTPAGALRVTAVESDGSISVTNDTSTTIDHWGAVANGNVYVAPGSISAGATATLTLDRRFAGWQGATLGDAVVDTKQLWDGSGYEVVAPLGYAAAGEMGQQDYAFGIAESTTIQATINGTAAALDGPTIWLTPFDLDTDQNEALGSIVGVGDFRHIEAGQGNIWIDSDRIVMSYSTPEAVAGIRLKASDQGWPVSTIEAWDWSTGAFTPVDAGQELDAARYVSPAGEVLARLTANDATGEPPYPQSTVVAWDPAA